MGSAVPRPGYNPGAFATYDPNTPQLFSQAPGLSPMPQFAAATGTPGYTPYAGIDPKTMAAWMELEGLTPEQDKIKRQLTLADKLRAGSQDIMKSQSKINTPNYAGALASIFQNYQAGQMDRQADTDLAGYATKRGDIMKRYFGKQFGSTAPSAGVDATMGE